ncbi:MFS superfamily sulfate permease-like transporter [Arthrobacter sp. UYP6]|uniref:hypothetical protein n=1 Tax=Arthrobacter sp. UYP6 TaxID=1756378 RepID=UPI0033932B94
MNASSPDAFPTAAGARRPARTATIVWGLLITATGILLLAWLLTDITLDPLVVLLGLTLGAGAALLIGGAVSALGGRKNQGIGSKSRP